MSSRRFVLCWPGYVAAGPVQLEQKQRHCEPENVKVSLDTLMSFRWIRERVPEGKLKLEGLYFEIQEGSLYRYVSRTDSFEIVAAAEMADEPSAS